MSKSITELFTSFPECRDENWDGEKKWYQKHLIYYESDRFRIELGDLFDESEKEVGEPLGLKFSVELHLFENTSQFDQYSYQQDKTVLKHEDHSLMIIFWRWGLYFACRGRKIREGS